MKESKRICFVLLFTWLLCSGNSTNWQGTGNMSQSNMTLIWDYINSNFNKSKTFSIIFYGERQYLSNFAANMSENLNNQWGSAWNVFAIYINDFSNSDSVLYGYGFRDHWMWYNGLQMNDPYYVSFIIWKDYNCHAWVTYNSLTSVNTNYADSDSFPALINSYKAATDINEIWSTAKSFVQGIQADVKFPNSAFTVIASQSSSVNYYARFCAVGYYTQTSIDSSSSRGAVFFMQMR